MSRITVSNPDFWKICRSCPEGWSVFSSSEKVNFDEFILIPSFSICLRIDESIEFRSRKFILIPSSWHFSRIFDRIFLAGTLVFCSILVMASSKVRYFPVWSFSIFFEGVF